MVMIPGRSRFLEYLITVLAVLGALGLPLALSSWSAFEAGVREGRTERVDEQFKMLGTVKKDSLCGSGPAENRTTFRCVQTADGQLWAVPK